MNSSRACANSDLDVIVDWRKPFVAGAETLEHVASEPRLSAMTTQWAMAFQAHSGTPDEASQAATQLMCRYAGAVHRYLLKALKNPDAASELDQEFGAPISQGRLPPL